MLNDMNMGLERMKGATFPINVTSNLGVVNAPI